MTHTLPFAHLNQSSIAEAGGKGANLGELTTAGFSVPPGFVLTTAAYDAFVQTNNLQGRIVELAASGQAADIRALFEQGTLADEMAAEIVAAYRQLVEGGHTAVAVRSSATAEDLPTASFAGQQDTFLNVRDEAALLDAVKRCWASLWTARALAYRQRQGIAPTAVSLAVVVQQMVPADAAGVLFTANPMNGARDQSVINATWGLGEALVGGQVTPDTVVVDNAALEVVSREIATKTVMTVRTDTGTAEQPIPPAQQNDAVLDEETAVALARLGTQIETHYGMPMDIEWAIADGKIAILQARPITSLPDSAAAVLHNVVWEPVAPNTIWMRRQIVEHMPEPLSPLFEDLYLHKGLRQSMDALLANMNEISEVSFDLGRMMPHGFARTINGYAYTGGSFKMTWDDFIGVLRIYARLNRFIHMKGFGWEDEAVPEYQAVMARWQALNLNEASDDDLLRGIADMAQADSQYWFASAKDLGFSRLLDPLFGLLLRSPLVRYALPDPRPVAATYLRGFDSKALDAQADLEALAAAIRASDALRELVMNTDADRLIDTLAAHPDAQSVSDGIQQYLDTYGHQIYNLDFADPTQNEDPLPILLSLKALVSHPPEQDVRSRQAQMAAEREALVAQTAASLNPLSRWLFNLVWKWTRQYAPYRENVMFYMGAAWPTLRTLAHELGQRLTDAGAIAQPDDIYYLDSAEITAVIHARSSVRPIPDYHQRVDERRALREARKRLTPLPTVPERGEMKFGPIKLSMFDPTPNGVDDDGSSVLNGYAVSTGRVTAPASVIHAIDDFDQMRPGTILVCTTTTPAWTPLFSQAVGLVTDVGGALAHGSIVAREYGIPAVMGTAVATERIRSGMQLTVDGNAGTVTLVDELDPEAEARRAAEQQAQERARARKRKLTLAVVVGAIVGFIWWRRRR